MATKNKTCNILGIAGSLRRESYNRSALRAATKLAPPGARIEVFELDGIPSFNQDDEQHPPARVVELKRRIRAADGLLFVTPEYNWSIPGVLKNAIDWASRPHGDSAWDGKPAAIIGASTGAIGTARAQCHLRQVLVYLNVYAINQPEVLIGNAFERFDAQGNLRDETSKTLIRQLLQNLMDYAERHGPAVDRARASPPLAAPGALPLPASEAERIIEERPKIPAAYEKNFEKYLGHQ
ncbi:MAG TPA: NAD(P)H-dependent oxidoreductase [Tepidisphaeraceae bacterium]|nr:NAD(P)H-dependent oxidoreductase [Tepidisphaeraceae bacterium]